MTRSVVALPLFATFASAAFVACSSSSPPPSAITGLDASVGDDAAASTVDAATADAVDASEPPWSGVTVEPGCTVDGCIRVLTREVGYKQSILASKAAAGQHVDNGIGIWLITYMSDGHETTGSVYVPDSTPPADGFPVVVMNQFTSGVGPPCAPSAGSLGVGVASTTALRGILTIVPDAPSYGGGKLGVYLAAPPAGRAALDAARAAFHLGPGIGVPVARRAVIAGLSQGGHATMSAAAEMPTYAPNLEIKGFAAVAPPADFRASTNANVRADTNFNWFLAARLHTWRQFYGLSGGAIFKDPVQSNVETWLETECEFIGSSGDYDTTLASNFPKTPSTALSDEFLGYAKNDSWPADWGAVYAASTPIPTATTLPIVVWQGDADTTVPKVQTDAYMAELAAAGVHVDYRVVAGSEHDSTALSSFTIAQAASDDAHAWITQHLGM